ncbi:MAG: hypothetical protein AB7I25_02455 [Vicinamibacterales bacterium]
MIVVATLMGLVAALAAGLSLGASTVALVARNHAVATATRAAADAGAEHALAVTLAALPRWRAEGVRSPAEGLPDLLARGRLWQAAGAAGFPSASRPFGDATYSADVVDDDAPVRGLAPADIAAIGENGSAARDANDRVVIRAVAAGPQGASATVEAVLGLVPLPALLLRGATHLGAVALAGREGRLHVTGDLEIVGPVEATGAVEATGRLDAAARPETPARASGRARSLPLPDVRPEHFHAAADVVLRADGLVGDAAGVVVCQPGGATCPAESAAWGFAAGLWTLASVPPVAATVFVEGDALLAPAGPAAEAVRLSVVATGSVVVRGPFAMRPAAGGVLLVAGRDIRIEGPLVAEAEEGLVAAGDQVAIVAPARLRGCVVAAGRGHDSPLVEVNTVSTGATVASDGGLAAVGFATWRVLGWRLDQAW